MRRYDLLPSAHADVLDLLAYLESYSDQASDRLIDALTDAFERLADVPGLGRDRGALSPDLRSFPVNRLRLTVFYYAGGDERDRILIARVLRQERDVTRAEFD